MKGHIWLSCQGTSFFLLLPGDLGHHLVWWGSSCFGDVIICTAHDITDSRRGPCKTGDALSLFELDPTAPVQSTVPFSRVYCIFLKKDVKCNYWAYILNLCSCRISTTLLMVSRFPSAMVFFYLNKQATYKGIRPGQCTDIFTRADTAPTQGQQQKQRPCSRILLVCFPWLRWRLWEDMEFCTFFVRSAQLRGNIQLLSAEQMNKSISWDPSDSPIEKPGLSWYLAIYSC